MYKNYHVFFFLLLSVITDLGQHGDIKYSENLGYPPHFTGIVFVLSFNEPVCWYDGRWSLLTTWKKELVLSVIHFLLSWSPGRAPALLTCHVILRFIILLAKRSKGTPSKEYSFMNFAPLFIVVSSFLPKIPSNESMEKEDSSLMHMDISAVIFPY